MSTISQVALSDRQTAPFDPTDLKQFIVEAKRKAVPSTDIAVMRNVLPGSVQMEYVKGPYSYKNIYCGFERFSGQETVHYQGRPVWGMGYTGGLVDHFMWDLQPQWVYAVLRASLAQVSEEMPFRGPLNYEYYGFEYTNHPLGHIAEFIGEETIKYRDSVVYHLWYVGGFIR